MCGAGKQIRRVVCQARHPLPDAISDLLADSQCDPDTKPEEEKECFIQPCEGLEWITSQWSGVSYMHASLKVTTPVPYSRLRLRPPSLGGSYDKKDRYYDILLTAQECTRLVISAKTEVVIP